jgi:predicted nucleic acid-binding protein
MIRVGLDTNILAYLAGVDRGVDDAEKIRRARDVVAQLGKTVWFVVPTQVLGELFNVLARTGLSREAAKAIVVRFHDTFEPAAGGAATMIAALDLAVMTQLQVWDALIVNTAADAGCAVLLTEDMQDGFRWRGLTLVNPLSDQASGRLAMLQE